LQEETYYKKGLMSMKDRGIQKRPPWSGRRSDKRPQIKPTSSGWTGPSNFQHPGWYPGSAEHWVAWPLWPERSFLRNRRSRNPLNALHLALSQPWKN